MDLIRQNLNVHVDENAIGPGDDEIEPEPNPGEDNPSSSDEMTVEWRTRMTDVFGTSPVPWEKCPTLSCGWNGITWKTVMKIR